MYNFIVVNYIFFSHKFDVILIKLTIFFPSNLKT